MVLHPILRISIRWASPGIPARKGVYQVLVLKPKTTSPNNGVYITMVLHPILRISIRSTHTPWKPCQMNQQLVPLYLTWFFGSGHPGACDKDAPFSGVYEGGVTRHTRSKSVYHVLVLKPKTTTPNMGVYTTMVLHPILRISIRCIRVYMRSWYWNQRQLVLTMVYISRWSYIQFYEFQ